MKKRVRTRFAPSPTGLLHLGSARTALFNYLFAHHYDGDFIVRFEDTDVQRNLQEAVTKQLKDLQWLGIKPDATIGSQDQYGPYLQSKRLSLYYQYVQKLITNQQAYYCFCTKEELAQEKQKQLAAGQKAPQYNRKCFYLSPADVQNNLKQGFAVCIRLQIPSHQEIKFTDLVYGPMFFLSQHIEDFVLLKADGYPTYNFAVVVDDHLMEITHVLRGSDHLSNTAKQVLLYQIYQWKVPTFGHLSLLQMANQKKMSKRIFDPLQYLDYYQENGYLPKGVFNYLSLLGWTPDKFQELFTIAELIQRFDGFNLNKAQSTFSLVKLDWINHKHINQMSEKEFAQYVFQFCQELKTTEKLSDQQLIGMATIFQKEINFFKQLPNVIMTVFFTPITYQKETTQILQKNKNLLDLFEQVMQKINWTEKNIQQALWELRQKTGLLGKDFFLPLRLAVSGSKHGPQMEKFLFFLGKDKIIKNIQKQQLWIQKLNH